MVGNFRPKHENRLFVSLHSCYPPLREALQSHGRGGAGLSVSEVNLTPEPGPSMNVVLLRWGPSLNIHSKLKGQRKTKKFGSDTSLVSSISPHSLSLETFLVTLSL